SQVGEDRVIHYLFRATREQARLYYIDIGAAFPVYDNNTYIFYLAGGHGITVEADPQYKPMHERFRPNDRHICAAVVPTNMATVGEISFARRKNRGHSSIANASIDDPDVEAILKVPTVTVADILSLVPQGQEIDLISIDVEGLDGQLLAEIDFARFKPKA